MNVDACGYGFAVCIVTGCGYDCVAAGLCNHCLVDYVCNLRIARLEVDGLYPAVHGMIAEYFGYIHRLVGIESNCLLAECHCEEFVGNFHLVHGCIHCIVVADGYE